VKTMRPSRKAVVISFRMARSRSRMNGLTVPSI
jgi:hypothetical protein